MSDSLSLLHSELCFIYLFSTQGRCTASLRRRKRKKLVHSLGPPSQTQDVTGPCRSSVPDEDDEDEEELHDADFIIIITIIIFRQSNVSLCYGGLLAVVLILLLQLILGELWRPETHLKKADERLVQVLLRAHGVQQVPLIRVDLSRGRGSTVTLHILTGYCRHTQHTACALILVDVACPAVFQ